MASLVALILSTMLGLVGPSPAPSAAVPHALDAFAQTWSGIDTYSATLVMHEIAGKTVQDRTYSYTFTKPASATIVITAGPGRGGKVVWTGGDTVIGSPPGFLSGLKLRFGITDAHVTSLRGDTIEMASFGWVLDHFRQSAGVKTESASAPIDGVATTAITLVVANPQADNGLTKEILLLSNVTRLPVDIERYIGDDLVKEIRFRDVVIGGAPPPTR